MIFLLSSLASLATIYLYGSEWYSYFWADYSMRQGLNLSLSNFTVTIPSSPNGTIVIESQIYVKNRSPLNLSVSEIFQGFYLQSFTTSNKIAAGYTSNLIQIATAEEEMIPFGITVPIGQNAALLAAANASHHWLWITWLTLQIQDPSRSHQICYMGSTELTPNETATGIPMTVSGCEGPSTPGGVTGGG